jgi:hypothetical protein
MKAGFSKVDITPRVGVELCGFGAYINRHSTRVVEPLYARAMAVDNGQAQWVIVSADLLAFSEPLTDRIRALVQKATGWHADQIMLHATHTHAGPCVLPDLIGWGDLDDPYVEMLPNVVAKACLDAIKDLQEATFHHAEVPAEGLSYNRELPAPGLTRELGMDWKWKTDKPGEIDTTAQVIRVDRGGRCAGFLTYFSCHPVVCCENNHELHGDFVGVATNRVEKQYPGAVGLFLQGALGDINPTYAHGPADESLVALERYGARFADVIAAGIRAARPLEVAEIGSTLSGEPHTLAKLDVAAMQAKLAEQADFVATGQVDGRDGSIRMAMVYIKSQRSILARHARGESFYTPMPVQAFRLGPITLTGMPLELMHRIKRRFQAERGSQALLLSVTNGFRGYAPLREYYQIPPFRYSANVVPLMLGRLLFTPDFEDEMVAAALTVEKRV